MADTPVISILRNYNFYCKTKKSTRHFDNILVRKIAKDKLVEKKTCGIKLAFLLSNLISKLAFIKSLKERRTFSFSKIREFTSSRHIKFSKILLIL